jgi:hypothetical protein
MTSRPLKGFEPSTTLLEKPAAKAFNYMLRRWPSVTRLLDDGQVCLTNNAAERTRRGIALGRTSWLFCGSNRGGQRAAIRQDFAEQWVLVDPKARPGGVLGANDTRSPSIERMRRFHRFSYRFFCKTETAPLALTH